MTNYQQAERGLPAGRRPGHAMPAHMLQFEARRLVSALTLSLVMACLPARVALCDEKPAGPAAEKTVQLVIDYGDGAELHLPAIAFRPGMTALAALDAAAAHPHGVKYKARGMGTNTLVTQIGDLKNEGAGTKNRNWIFKVDGKDSEVGAGARELKAGEIVLWKFGAYDYNR